MPPEFPSYELEELEQRGRDLIRLRRPGADVSDKSDFDISARLIAALAWNLQQQAKVARTMLDPRRAFGDYLAQYLREAGLGRTITETSPLATKSTGKVIIRSATASQTQLAGTELRHADGTKYTLDADVTTPATATKVLRAGHRSGRRRLFQGHVGGGFVTAAAGEVYLVGSELCALLDVENGAALKRRLFDLYNPLDAEPALHATFTQQLAAIGNITAVVAGSVSNKDPKDVLTIVSPTGTILGEAIILTLAGGANAMNPAAQQSALRDLLALRQGTGTIEDIRQAALSYPLVPLRECYVIPATYGLGTYTLLPIHADGQYLGATQLANIVAYTSSLLSPVDKLYSASVYEQLDSDVDYINVACAEIYAPDWALPDQTVRGVTVTTTGSSTLILSAVGNLAEGDRILVQNFGASGPYQCQRRVATLVGLTVTLDQALPFPPDVGAYVTPGGPLGDALIEAIYAAYEARAPSVGDTGPSVRYPAADVANDPDAIVGVVSRVAGVIDAVRHGGSAPTLSAPGGVLVPGWVIRMYPEV